MLRIQQYDIFSFQKCSASSLATQDEAGLEGAGARQRYYGEAAVVAARGTDVRAGVGEQSSSSSVK